MTMTSNTQMPPTAAEIAANPQLASWKPNGSFVDALGLARVRAAGALTPPPISTFSQTLLDASKAGPAGAPSLIRAGGLGNADSGGLGRGGDLEPR